MRGRRKQRQISREEGLKIERQGGRYLKHIRRGKQQEYRQTESGLTISFFRPVGERTILRFGVIEFTKVYSPQNISFKRCVSTILSFAEFPFFIKHLPPNPWFWVILVTAAKQITDDIDTLSTHYRGCITCWPFSRRYHWHKRKTGGNFRRHQRQLVAGVAGNQQQRINWTDSWKKPSLGNLLALSI